MFLPGARLGGHGFADLAKLAPSRRRINLRAAIPRRRETH